MADQTMQELAPGDPARNVLEAVEKSGALGPDVSARDAVQEVLCAITRRVSQGEATKVRHSLSPGLGDLLRVCTMHRDSDAASFGRAELLEQLAAHFGTDAAQAERITRAVCRALQERFPTKELHDVESQLPGEIARLWRG